MYLSHVFCTCMRDLYRTQCIKTIDEYVNFVNLYTALVCISVSNLHLIYYVDISSLNYYFCLQVIIYEFSI